MPGPGVGAIVAVASKRGRRIITRTLLWASPLFLLAPLLVGMLLLEPPKNNCTPVSIVEPNTDLSADQRTNATAIIAAGRKLKVPDFAITIALAVALQESSLTNVDHGDAAGPDSRGLFQQRTSWGSEAERMDPEQSATLFYKALLSVPGWDSLPLTDAAARVQKPRADLRGEYAKHEGTARMLLAEAGGDTQLVSQANPTAGATPKIDPSTWKLTLPTGDAEEKRGGELASFVHPVLYHPGRGGGWVFNAPAGGSSTDNSSYPRTELRELSGGKEAAWTNRTGVHEMVLQQAITADAGGAGVVAGQIHDDKDDVLRVVLKGSRLYASFSAGKGKDLPYQTIDANYRLGTPFTLRIVADPSGVHVFYNGQQKANLKRTFDGGYFKAGAYTQSTDRSDGAGEVVIYGLSISHDGKSSSAQFGTPIPGQQACTCTLPGAEHSGDDHGTETTVTGPAPAECADGGEDLQLVSTTIKNGPLLKGLDANNFGKTGPHWKHGHTGNDYGAACGTPVYAVHDGTVRLRTGNSWYGKWLVTVRTGPASLSTDYAHMESVDVDDGQPVKAGTKLGTVGDLGNSFGCHLHLEVHTKGGDGGTSDDAIDPHTWLSTNGGQLIRTITKDVFDDKRD